MRTITRPQARVLSLLLGLAALGQLPAGAQVQLPEDMTAEQLADIRRRIAEAAQPGDEHALLATLAGEWHQVLKLRPAPGADVMTMEGTATNEMILGGRFLKTESNLHLPGVEGGEPVVSRLRPEVGGVHHDRDGHGGDLLGDSQRHGR